MCGGKVIWPSMLSIDSGAKKKVKRLLLGVRWLVPAGEFTSHGSSGISAHTPTKDLKHVSYIKIVSVYILKNRHVLLNILPKEQNHVTLYRLHKQYEQSRRGHSVRLMNPTFPLPTILQHHSHHSHPIP